MTTGLCTSAIRRLTAGLLALFVAMSALAVIGASPAGAHRGPAHEHESSAGQSADAEAAAGNRPTSSRAPTGASSSGGQPTEKISKGANDVAMAAASAVGFIHAVAAVAVFSIALTKAASDNWYQGYTGPSERSGRNQPTSSRVPANAR